MKKVVLLSSKDMDQWDFFVVKHPFGRIYHLSRWKDVIEDSFSHIRGFFLALRNSADEEILAGLPLYSVRSWVTGNRLVSIPFGTLGDPLVSTTEEAERLNAETLKISSQLPRTRIEIKTNKSSSLIASAGLLRPSYFDKHHYLELDDDLDKIRKKFHRSSIDRKISKASKEEFKVKQGTDLADLLEFHRIFVQTRMRLGLPPIPYYFFKSLWVSFHPLGLLSLVLITYKDRTVGGNLILKFKDLAIVDYSADDDSMRQSGVNQLLWWESIKLAHEEGYKVFSFGRTSRKNQGLLAYKQRWGTQVEELTHFFYPKSAARKYEHRESSLSTKIIHQICFRVRHPAVANLLGGFVYRHMG